MLNQERTKTEIQRGNLDLGDAVLAVANAAMILAPTPLPIKVSAIGNLVNFFRKAV